MQVIGTDGRALDAHFSIDCGQEVSLVLESRGGTARTGNARNLDYALGLATLLQRLKSIGAVLTDAVVDSERTQSMGLSRAERRLELDRSFPIALAEVEETEPLRLALGAAQGAIGRKPGATGRGNNTKRIRLFFEQRRYECGEKLEIALAGWGAPLGVLPEAPQTGGDAPFDLSGIEDARNRRLAAIVQRQGQPAFRKILFEAYGAACCVSSCRTEPVLEAAHIVPYLGTATNHVSNGLLLRADLHTLFDRGLLSVATDTWQVRLSPQVEDTEYTKYHGARIRLPESPGQWPDTAALDRHRCESGLI